MIGKLLAVITVQILLFCILQKISEKFNFFDYPNIRKKHTNPTSYLGGVNIIFTYLFIIFLFDVQDNFFTQLIYFSSLFVLIGLIDDKMLLRPLYKLILQSLIIFFFIWEFNLIIKDIGNYEYLGKLSLGKFSFIFTFLCCMLFINAFNYIDGIDFLATNHFIIIIGTYAFLCDFLNLIQIRNLLFLLILPTLVFLIFNKGIKNLKFFLGDSGSNLLSFIIIFISIGLYKFYDFHPLMIMWPLSFIVYEFLTTNILRLIKNGSFITPGLDHLHYEIIQKHRTNLYSTNLIFFVINIFLIGFGFLAYFQFGTLASFILFIVFYIFYFMIRFKFYYKNNNLMS